MKIVYTSRSVPHYRQAILQRIAECGELSVVSGGESLGLGKESTLTNLRVVNLKQWSSPFGRGRVYWQDLGASVRELSPDLIISEFGLSLLHIYWLIWMRRKLGFKLAFWTHGMGVNYEGKAATVADKARVKMLRAADGLFYYTEGCRARLDYEIGDRVPGWIVWNTVDTEAINSAWYEIKDSSSQAGDPYVVYLGRLVDSKRVEELSPLAERLKILAPRLRWKIIGSGERRSTLEAAAAAKGLAFDFLGPITDEADKGRWLKHSVAMVCPGMLGLNVVDSLGYGCPVLSYRDQPSYARHSPESEYLHEGEDGNGWLAESEDQMVENLLSLVHDFGLRRKMGLQARATFLEECPIERQLSGFREGIHELAQK